MSKITCISCGNVFSGVQCPACQFYAYKIAGTNYEEEMAHLEALATQHRDKYLSNMEFGAVYISWKDKNGTLIENERSTEYFAQGPVLKEGIQWSAHSLARIPSVKTVAVSIAIRKGDTEWIKKVSLPNLREPELQQLGFRLEKKLHVRVLLKNGSSQTESELISLCQL